MRYGWLVLLFGVNFTLIGLLIDRVLADSSDKGFIVLIFGYVALVVINLVVWGLLALLKSKLSGPMGTCVGVLSALFVPLLIYALNT